jgi:hypothetical protein
MKFISAFVLVGTASSGVVDGGVVDRTPAMDIASHGMTARSGSGGLRSSTVVASAHPQQNSDMAAHSTTTVASAVIGRALSMDNNMVMVQGELKREVRRQGNEQFTRLAQDAEDTTAGSGTREEKLVENKETTVVWMEGFADRVMGWFANRRELSGEEAGSNVSAGGGLRNWFLDRQANQEST